MPFLKNVVKDLVEQRLWPVAVLLVAALVAGPVLVSRHGADPVAAPIPGATAAGASPDAPTASKAAVTIDPEPEGAVHDGGRVRPRAVPRGGGRVEQVPRAEARARSRDGEPVGRRGPKRLVPRRFAD